MAIKIGFNQDSIRRFQQQYKEIIEKTKAIENKNIKMDITLDDKGVIKGINNLIKDVDKINNKQIKIAVSDTTISNLRTLTTEVANLQKALSGIDIGKLSNVNIPRVSSETAIDRVGDKRSASNRGGSGGVYSDAPSQTIYDQTVQLEDVRKRISDIKSELNPDTIIKSTYKYDEYSNRLKQVILDYKDTYGNAIKEILGWQKNYETGITEFQTLQANYVLDQQKSINTLKQYEKAIESLSGKVDKLNSGFTTPELSDRLTKLQELRNSINSVIGSAKSGDMVNKTLLNENLQNDIQNQISVYQKGVDEYSKLSNRLKSEKERIKNEFLFFNRELLKSTLFAEGSDDKELVNVNKKWIDEYKKQIKELESVAKSKFDMDLNKEYGRELENDERAIRKNYELSRAEHDITVKLHERSQAHTELIRLVKEQVKIQDKLKNTNMDDKTTKAYQKYSEYLNNQIEDRVSQLKSLGINKGDTRAEIAELGKSINKQLELKRIENERSNLQKTLYQNLREYNLELENNKNKILSGNTGELEKSGYQNRNKVLNDEISQINAKIRGEKLYNEELQSGINKDVEAIRLKGQIGREIEKDKANSKSLNTLYDEYANVLKSIEKTNLEITKAEIKGHNEIKKTHELEREKLEIKKQQLEQDQRLTGFKGSEQEARVQKEILETQKRINLEHAKAKDTKTGSYGILNQMFDRLKSSVVTLIKYRVIWEGVRRTIQEVKDGVVFINQMNKKQTEIQMITGVSNEQVKNLTKDYNELAQQLKVTTSEVMDGSVEFFRAGKSVEETGQLVKNSIMASKLAGIESAQATEYLTSILNGFQLEADKSVDIVDKLVTIDNNASTSFREMAEALKHSAGSANQAGVSLDKLASWVGTVSSVTRRSASSIGESFKTIFARMQDIQDGVIDEYDKIDINKVETALARVGTKLRSTMDTFRPMSDVMDDVAKKWKSLTEVEQSNIAKAIAGTRQRENFIVLMQHYNEAIELEQKALNSSGSAHERYQYYLESTEAKLNELKSAKEEFWLNFLNSDMVNTTIESMTELVRTIDFMVNQMQGSTSTVLGLSGAFLLLIANAKKLSLVLSGIFGVSVGVGALAFGGLAAAIAGATYMIGKHISKQKELQRVADETKDSIDNINESVNKGDNNKAIDNLDTLKKYKKELEDIKNKRKEIIDEMNRIAVNPQSMWSTEDTQKYSKLRDELAEVESKYQGVVKAVEKAGIAQEELNRAVSLGEHARNAENIKQQVATQNMKQQTEESRRLQEETRSLANEYLQLNALENINAQQKQRMTELALILKDRINGLVVAEDEEGNIIVQNTGLVHKRVNATNTEIMSVADLTQAKLDNAKRDAEIEVGKTKLTYTEINKRIKMYESEMKSLGGTLKSRSGQTMDELEAKYKAGTITDIENEEYNRLAKGAMQISTSRSNLLHKLNKAKDELDNIYSSGGGAGGIPPSIPSGSGFTSPLGDSKSKKDKQKTTYTSQGAEYDKYMFVLDAINGKLTQQDLLVNSISSSLNKYKSEGSRDSMAKTLEYENVLYQAQLEKLKQLKYNTTLNSNALRGLMQTMEQDFRKLYSSSSYGLGQRTPEWFKKVESQLFPTKEFSDQKDQKAYEERKKQYEQWVSTYTKVREQYHKLTVDIDNLENEIEQSRQRIDDLSVSMLEDTHKTALNSINKEMSELELRAKSIESKNYAGQVNVINEKIKLTNRTFNENIKYLKQLEEQSIYTAKGQEKLTQKIDEQIKKVEENKKSLIDLKKSLIDLRDTAYNTVNSLRDKIVNALKKELEELKKEELKSIEDKKKKEQERHNERLENLKEELRLLRDDTAEKEKQLDKMKKEYALWQKDDSEFAKGKMRELKKQIDDLEKQLKIKELEKEIEEEEKKYKDFENKNKDEVKKIEEKYKKLLDEKELYHKADKMLTENNMNEIVNLLSKYDTKFADKGSKLGKIFMEKLNNEVKVGLKSFTELINGTFDKAIKDVDNVIGKSDKTLNTQRNRKTLWVDNEVDRSIASAVSKNNNNYTVKQLNSGVRPTDIGRDDIFIGMTGSSSLASGHKKIQGRDRFSTAEQLGRLVGKPIVITKGGADEKILNAMYGNKIETIKSDVSMFAGKDRFETNKMFVDYLSRQGVRPNKTLTKEEMLRYKNGGLVDYTGLAYVDGSKNSPEYVLNSQQTQGFLKLVDVLDGFNLNNLSTPFLDKLPMFADIFRLNDTKDKIIEIPEGMIKQDINISNYTPFDVDNNMDNLNRAVKSEISSFGGIII